MNRTFARTSRFLPILVLLATGVQAHAAPPPPEQLLPASTTEFVSIADLTKLSAEWQQTQFAQLMNDAIMQPYLAELNDHTKGYNYLLDAIGVDFEKVKASAGGELGWAVVLVSPKEVAHVLTLDMNGKREGAGLMLGEIAQKLGKQGGRGVQRTLEGGMTAVVVDLPNKLQIIYGVKDTLLIITDHLPTLQGMMQRWNGSASNSLANVPAYRHVARKTQPQDGERVAIRFFFEPIARTEAAMIYFPEMKKAKGENLVQLLRAEGVDGIKGVGGAIAFQQNGTDLLIRCATHVPEPLRGAMRMVKLPNNVQTESSSWMPPDLSGYSTFGLDLVNAYDSFGTLFGRVTGESPQEFHRIMATLKNDKDGPQVDVRAEILQQLQERVTLINDATRPIGPKSERFLIAIPAKDAIAERVLTDAIRRCFESDRRFKPRTASGVTVWEYQVKSRAKKDGSTKAAKVASTCIAVARGHLFVSTHGSLLDQALAHQGPTFGQSADYQHMMKELTRLGMGPSSSRSMVRLEVGAEATYEMMRANRLDQADSVYAFILTKLLKDEAKGKMRADGGKLPTFSQASKFFSLAGAFTVSDPDGWTVVGTVLKK